MIRTLLVTQDESLAGLIRWAGGRHECDVRVARTVEEARASLVDDVTDSVLVDLRTSPGFVSEATTRVGHVAAFHSSADPAVLLDCLRSGARDFLALPVVAEDLDDAFRRWRTSAGSAARATLEYRDTQDVLRRFPLYGSSKITVGREADNDLVFDVQIVSRQHAVIEFDEGEFVVADLGSRHGVSINDEPIRLRAILRDGDRIRLGKPAAPELVFHQASAESDRAASGRAGGTISDLATLPNRELRELAGLLDTFLHLRGELVVDEVLDTVLRRAVEFADAERGLILLAPISTDSSEPEAAASPDEDLQPARGLQRDGSPLDLGRLSISTKIPREVFRTGRGLVLTDLLADEKAQIHLRTIDMGVRSAMCVPLRARDDDGAPSSIGVLYLDSGSRARPFSDHVLRALESLAHEAAAAITNARLYQVSQEKRRIDEELKIAREIQSNLLPAAEYKNGPIRLKGTSRPSREVGGDLINYYPVDGERLGLLVGDVSGKGVAAAIFSAMLDGHFLSMSSLAGAGERLGAMSGELNRYLVQKSGGQKFVSFVFGSLDREGRFTYVNAGHNPPLRVSSSGEVRWLKTGGMIMGMLDDASYETGIEQLDPGDALILYSDGITEARGEGRELYGVGRLLGVAVEHRRESADAIHEAILCDMDGFVEGMPQSDDVTLLVVKWGCLHSAAE